VMDSSDPNTEMKFPYKSTGILKDHGLRGEFFWKCKLTVHIYLGEPVLDSIWLLQTD